MTLLILLLIPFTLGALGSCALPNLFSPAELKQMGVYLDTPNA